MLPWNLRQLISYFFALIIYSINLLKTARKTFATGNAIYPLPRTIIQITNDNSIFCKEGIIHENCIIIVYLLYFTIFWDIKWWLCFNWDTMFLNFLWNDSHLKSKLTGMFLYQTNVLCWEEIEKVHHRRKRVSHITLWIWNSRWMQSQNIVLRAYWEYW